MGAHTRPPRVGSQVVATWRATLVRSVEEAGTTHQEARRTVRTVERALRWVAERLHAAHGTPHLGNLLDPTDELVLIALSRKTPERAYLSAFDALKRIGPWNVIAVMDAPEVARAIRGGGLEAKKARAILAALEAITHRFGAPDLSRAADLDDAALFELLAGLPEIGPKSARCVMLYSFDRPVFPVDAHVGRVLARLGCLRPLDIDLTPMGHRQRQRALEHVVPPDLRYGLHVNLIAHGRSTCSARAPRCAVCTLGPRCESWEDVGGRRAAAT